MGRIILREKRNELPTSASREPNPVPLLFPGPPGASLKLTDGNGIRLRS